MTNADIDFEAFLAEDFETIPPCECIHHEIWGSGDVIALAIVISPICGCKPPRDGFMCRGCITRCLTNPSNGVCGGCGVEWSPFNLCIERIEYL